MKDKQRIPIQAYLEQHMRIGYINGIEELYFEMSDIVFEAIKYADINRN